MKQSAGVVRNERRKMFMQLPILNSELYVSAKPVQASPATGLAGRDIPECRKSNMRKKMSGKDGAAAS
jgi:hypothetical protein